jgi:hypothetical protein
MRTIDLAIGVAIAVGVCAGRAPQPVAVVQPQDRFADCTAITAEIEANNQKAEQRCASAAAPQPAPARKH